MLMTDTRQTRALRREFASQLKAAFPVPGNLAVQRLRSDRIRGGSSLVVL
jgi:hypothetical protein